MINWARTSPLITGLQALRAKQADSSLNDWSVAELLRGDRLASPPLKGGAPDGRWHDPNQPRVPAGHTDGGQWTRLGDVRMRPAESELDGLARQRDAQDARDNVGWNAQEGSLSRLLDSIDSLNLPEKASYRFHQYVETREVGRDQQSFRYAEHKHLSFADEHAVERTTKILQDILVRVNQAVSQRPNLISARLYGIAVHKRFADEVRARNLPGIGRVGVEQSFVKTLPTRYGLEGSIRTDIVLRNENDVIIAIYDLKTGGATMRPSREKKIREYTNVSPDVRLIIFHAVRGR